VSERLRDASAVLEGGGGLGHWKELHGQLVARRNRLVAQLGEAFKVTATTRLLFLLPRVLKTVLCSANSLLQVGHRQIRESV
jgi:hypothetical protein